MVGKIMRIGNSCGLIFDRMLLDLTRLKLDDEASITVHAGGAVTITPLRDEFSPEEFSSVVNDVLADYSGTLKKLS